MIRALLWPRPSLAPLLEKARLAGHISKVSELDQYHQFTLADAGGARMDRLVGQHPATLTAREPTATYGSSPEAESSGRKPSTPRAPKKKPPTKPKAGRAGSSPSRTKKPNAKTKAKGRPTTSPRQLSLLPKEE